MAKVISFTLDAKSVASAIRELEKYKTEFLNNMKKLQHLVAERIRWTAETGFSTAMVGDYLFGQPDESKVTVEMQDDGDVTVVFANGDQAVFIEFGAGVYHNGPVGSQPHPWERSEPEYQGFAIGTYGKGNGRRRAWGYKALNGSLVVTRGTPAAMPMYHGYAEAIAVLDDLVKEVFG